MVAAPSFQLLRPNASANPVSPASKINPESDAFSTLHGLPHWPGPVIAFLDSCRSHLNGLLAPVLAPCLLSSQQPGGYSGTSGTSHPFCAQNTGEIPHLTPYKSQSSYKDLSSLLISFHSPHCSLCSSHTSFCHPLKIPTLLLPQGLCTCSLCLRNFPPS